MTQPEAPSTIILLVIDDEPENRDLVARVFRPAADVEVVGVASGSQALAMLQQKQADIMLVDQSMPGMSGIEFVEQARRVVPNAVTIMVTAYPELDDVLAAKQSGLIQHLVSKPWRPSDLKSAVRRALMMRELRDVISRLNLDDQPEA